MSDFSSYLQYNQTNDLFARTTTTVSDYTQNLEVDDNLGNKLYRLPVTSPSASVPLFLQKDINNNLSFVNYSIPVPPLIPFGSYIPDNTNIIINSGYAGTLQFPTASLANTHLVTYVNDATTLFQITVSGWYEVNFQTNVYNGGGASAGTMSVNLSLNNAPYVSAYNRTVVNGTTNSIYINCIIELTAGDNLGVWWVNGTIGGYTGYVPMMNVKFIGNN